MLRRFPALASAALALLAAACSSAPAPDWSKETPAVVDDDSVAELLRPREGEELVLANFWATW